MKSPSTDSSDDPFAKALRDTYNQLAAEKSVAQSDIAQLDSADRAGSGRQRNARS
ncbi:hypothetical protein ACFXPR_20550 [Nocardia tengchongensis]|uniref:hypothetical protein n=1 Tax=Nocardia tengchongensis TaxID=2055889 RepID=UPI0036A1D110